MNDIEARLRDAYRAAAATVSPDYTRQLGEQAVTISPPARPTSGRGHRRIMIPLAAAAAVALTGVLTAVLPGVLAGPKQVAASPAPRYVAGLLGNGAPNSLQSLVIRDVVTGARVASIATPRPGLIFAAVATGDGTHFVADLQRDGECQSWLYQFQLNRAGRPSALSPYKLFSVRQSVGSIALSADNKTFAYYRSTCGSWGHVQAWISVLSLQTMRTRSWQVPKYAVDNISPHSLTANGGLLAYGIGSSWRVKADVYLLRTSAPPGPIVQRSREMATDGQFGRSSVIQGYAITPDGRALYIQSRVSRNNTAAGHSWQINVIDVATGRIRVVRQYPGAYSNYLTPDWSVRQALVPSMAWQSPGTVAPQRFLVISLVTGRVLRSLNAKQWDPNFSLYAW